MVEQYPHRLYIDQVSEVSLDANGNWENAGVPFNPQIGDEYGGGVIFYIDSTGKHGLIKAKDEFDDVDWGLDWIVSLGCNQVGIGYGENNTNIIVSFFGIGEYSAAICRNYNGGGFIDWFMPSKDELGLLGELGYLNDKIYWSSSEKIDEVDHAWYWDYSTSLMRGSEKFEKMSVLPIRKF